MKSKDISKFGMAFTLATAITGGVVGTLWSKQSEYERVLNAEAKVEAEIVKFCATDGSKLPQQYQDLCTQIKSEQGGQSSRMDTYNFVTKGFGYLFLVSLLGAGYFVREATKPRKDSGSKPSPQ